MDKAKGFKDLIVWKKSYQLVLETYKITKSFPKDEAYALTQQIRRCAVSIPSNIAEGYGRQHKTEYRQFLAMALGSLCEFETQYHLSVDLGYGKSEVVEGLIKEVGAMLYRMVNPIQPSYRVSPIRYPLKGSSE